MHHHPNVPRGQPDAANGMDCLHTKVQTLFHSTKNLELGFKPMHHGSNPLNPKVRSPIASPFQLLSSTLVHVCQLQVF
jgi:hypothetical protein